MCWEFQKITNLKKIREAQLAHQEYVRLIEEAYDHTNMAELKRVLDFLQSSLKEQVFFIDQAKRYCYISSK